MTVLDELNEIKELVNNDKHFKYKNIVNFCCKSIEKSLKALEIIKEKECDMRWFKFCIKGNAEVETYNNGLSAYYEKLTEEEFDILKAVLE